MFWGGDKETGETVKDVKRGGKGGQKGGWFDKHCATLLWLVSHKFQGMEGSLEVEMK